MSANSMPAQSAEILLYRYIGSCQWDRALKTARELLSIDPESSKAHRAAAQALVNLKRYASAETHLAKYFAKAANDNFAHRLAAIAAFERGNLEAAEYHIQKSIELNPRSPGNWYQLGVMRQRKGLIDAAEECVRRGLNLSPGDAMFFNLLGICRQGTVASVENYLRALEINPVNGNFHNNLGTFYMNTARDYPAAEACFRRALQCDPVDRLALKNLVMVCRCRDPIYQFLLFPRFLTRRFSCAGRDVTVPVRSLMVGLCVALGHYAAAIFAFWYIFCLPLLGVYLLITANEINKRVGIPGARRGGLSYSGQVGIFIAVAACYSAAISWLYMKLDLPREFTLFYSFLLAAIVEGTIVTAWWKEWRQRTRDREVFLPAEHGAVMKSKHG